MGNLGDPTEIEREMQEMEKIKEMSMIRRQMQEVEEWQQEFQEMVAELQEMEDEEEEEEEEEKEEKDFFEERRFDLFKLSQEIESLEDYVATDGLDVWELELQNQMVSYFFNSLRINKDRVETKIQEENKDRDQFKALVEKWMLCERDSLRKINESLNKINSENYSFGTKIIEINNLNKELDFEIADIDMVVRSMEEFLQSYTFV